MTIKKPIVIGSGSELFEEIQSGDTISTSSISDSTDKRFVTDKQQSVAGKVLTVGITDTTPPLFTDNGNGSGTIASCVVAIRDNPNHDGIVQEYTIEEDTFSFTDGVQEFIAVYYNNGNPIYIKTSTEPNGSDTSLIYVVWRVGNTLHSANQDSIGIGLPNKLNSRILHTEPYAVSSNGGLIISETQTPSPRTILVSSAIVYIGACPNEVFSFNSSIHNLYKVIHTISGWTYTIGTQYDNIYYNPNSSGEVELDNNKYKYHLYFRSIGDVRDVFYVESETQYNSAADAKIASEIGRTDIPIVLKNHCLFIGRSIIQKGSTTGETTPFIRTRGNFTTFVPEHNELINIQGGNTTERYHLSANEVSTVQNSKTYSIAMSIALG